MDLSELTTRMAGAEDVEFDALAMRQALSAADIKAALQSAWDYAADKPQNVLAAASPLLGAGMGAAIAGKGNRKKGAAAGGLLGLSPAAVLGVQMLQKALNKPGFPAEGPVDPNAVSEDEALKMELDAIGANEEDWAAANRLPGVPAEGSVDPIAVSKYEALKMGLDSIGANEENRAAVNRLLGSPAEGSVDPRAVAEAKALKMVLDSIGANEEDWAAVNRLLNGNGSTRLPPDPFSNTIPFEDMIDRGAPYR